jgi:Txe/YoeB family toxin of toxin-antitoxin system
MLYLPPLLTATGKVHGNDNFNGNPEALKGDLQGYWSRRITSEHRLVYKYEKEEILIAACRSHYGK